ncbi:hypothetical protein COCSUDRAFT_42253 [Coccomyxa subellipsoidea C-169]|uniref:Uncharacterized protein n=1 Tax=Coccomyxa subellipsoidea (strain C-169) TaxID=574566 RepID=I0YW17_COCSC|nr:hypothetical protein COCSUDRAFT_42253 [Coccomyxa subellipsoidea C-169]EIE22586.1 hypothetical protein COCSUDRAFT_42253 [Coccomyxa subellipsoidea C-169]|eukprot:XP_005647130.1 hypothetical protein COCSUDRAFT_42253 [Coccomyxa subellipsoidea C-169]
MAPPKLGQPLGRPQMGLLGRGTPGARLLRRPRPERGRELLPSPLTLLCLCLAAGFAFLLLGSSRMDSLISRSNRGGRRMTVRMGSERHISGDSAVMPLPDAVPEDLVDAAAILGRGTRYRGSAKLESVATEGGHLGGLALPKMEPGGGHASADAAKSGVNKAFGEAGLRALEREGLDSFVDQQRVTDDDSQPDLRALGSGGGGGGAAALLGKLPEQLPVNMQLSGAQRAGSDPAAAAAAVANGAGKGNKATSAQEVLAQGLRESNRKRAHQQLDRHAVQIQVSKSLVDLPVDTRDSLLSSMGVSKDGKGSEKPPAMTHNDSAGADATVSAAAGGAVSADSAAYSSADSALPGQGTAAAVAISGTAAEAENEEEEEWDFDRKAQALQAELFDLKGLIPGALRPLKDRPRQKRKGLSGVSKAMSSRGMPASGECQMLLAKAIEGDKEREVRQREEHLKSLPNIWDPETEKKAREPEKFRTRADHAGKPTEFPPGTEGMLGRQYTEADASQSLEDHRSEGGIAALDKAPPAAAGAANPESVTAQARALEGMLQALCGGDEECMLEVWRSCKEQPKCVESLYNERMAEEKEKAAAAGANKAQGAAGGAGQPGEGSGGQPSEAAAAAKLQEACGGRAECIQQVRLMCGSQPACVVGVAKQVLKSSKDKSGDSKGKKVGAAAGGAVAAALDLLPLEKANKAANASQKMGAVAGASASLQAAHAEAASSEQKTAQGTQLQTSAASADRWAQELMSRMCQGRQACVEDVWRLCKGRYDCIKTSWAAHAAQTAQSGGKLATSSATSAAAATAR